MLKKEGRFLLVAFLEGFTTLAFQMVALRKAVPFVGSSIVLTSIVIGIILLALSAGYFAGGLITARLENHKILARLRLYLLISGLYYLLIVYPSFDWVLKSLLGTMGYIPTLFIFAIVFFAIPTFLASHTMPIITHVSQGTKGYAAGKILFISTIGSFLGSTFTTLVLFPQLGVYRTGIVASVILLVCSVLIGGYKLIPWKQMIATCILVVSCMIYRPSVTGWYEETPYQTVRVLEGMYQGRLVRIMQLNGGSASGIDVEDKTSFFKYVRTIMNVIHEKKPKNIAVIGAAGCTMPQELARLDFVDRIDVIDIDERVFPIAEQGFLQEKLDAKVTPIAQSARGWIYDMIQAGKKYDMIVVDAYNGTSLPDELVTKEFFEGLAKLSDQITVNLITDKKMESEFSHRFFASMQAAVPYLAYADASSTASDNNLGNVILTTFPTMYTKEIPDYRNLTPYTDDKNNADELRVDVMY